MRGGLHCLSSGVRGKELQSTGWHVIQKALADVPLTMRAGGRGGSLETGLTFRDSKKRLMLPAKSDFIEALATAPSVTSRRAHMTAEGWLAVLTIWKTIMGWLLLGWRGGFNAWGFSWVIVTPFGTRFQKIRVETVNRKQILRALVTAKGSLPTMAARRQTADGIATTGNPSQHQASLITPAEATACSLEQPPSRCHFCRIQTAG